MVGLHGLGDVLSRRGVVPHEGVAVERTRPDRVGSQRHHGDPGLSLDLAVRPVRIPRPLHPTMLRVPVIW